MTKPSDFDVAIVGGGPAGLAAGIGFAKRGLSTVLFEKGTWPVDKACGEGIMPIGVRELEFLGVLPLIKSNSHPFRGIQLISRWQRRVGSDFADGLGLGVRRTILSSALFERAQQESALVLSHRSKVTHLTDEHEFIQIRSNQGEVRCRFLVGADGLRSSTRNHLNREMQPSSPRRYGANQHFKIKPWSHSVEVYFSDGVEAYVTPVNSDEVGVAFLWHYDRFSPQLGKQFLIEQCLERFSMLKERLKGCETLSPVQAMGPFLQKVGHSQNFKFALIGDAAGYLDAITGEGISIALYEARLLVTHFSKERAFSSPKRALVDAHFFRERRKMRRRSNLTTRLALLTARYAAMQAPLFPLLARYPTLLKHFLSFSHSHCHLNTQSLSNRLEHNAVHE